jgi:hypothetical protein
MATYVEAGRTAILIDPGATLAESRFNLPPAEEEREALGRARDRIGAFAVRAGTVFISHYHEDHYAPEPALYAARRVLAKDPRRMIGGLQARRAAELWRSLASVARVESAEGRAGELGDLMFKVSPPLAHGPEGTVLGYCVALTLTDRAEGFRFVFASDVQGPLSSVATAYLIRERPHLLYLSGPPSYLEKQLGREVIDRAIDNLERVVDATGCRVIMDHYALRDGDPRERFARLWEGDRVVTAAGYLGLRDCLLEAKRCVLWASRRKPPARIEAGERMGRRKPLARIEPGPTRRPRRWARRAQAE